MNAATVVSEAAENATVGDRWPARREEYLRGNPSCVVCRSCNPFYNILVHHLTYERAAGDELDSDLITLCWADHGALHADYRRELRQRYGDHVPRQIWEQQLRSFSLRWIVQANALMHAHHSR